MIGWLTGQVIDIENDNIILNSNGIGYNLIVNHRLVEVIMIGQSIEVFIETEFRQDYGYILIAFLTKEQRGMFRIMRSIQGVGIRSALAIISTYEAEELWSRISMNDSGAFKAITGIGPKLASRIVSELQEKARKISPNSHKSVAIDSKSYNKIEAIKADTITALISLGFLRAEAENKLKNNAQHINESITLSALIKLCLN